MAGRLACAVGLVCHWAVDRAGSVVEVVAVYAPAVADCAELAVADELAAAVVVVVVVVVAVAS